MAKIDDTTKQALRTIIDEMVAFFRELDGESPRAAAVLAVAALEDELDRLLRTQFPTATNNSLWKKIAGPGFTPLGSLKAKAHFAQAFGFFGPKTQKTIDLVGQVRNKFAHRTYVRDFDHPEVLETCRELADNPILSTTFSRRPSPEVVRQHYINTVRGLIERIESIQAHVLEIDGDLDPLP